MLLNEIFKKTIIEGGNSELPNLDDPTQSHQAQHVDLSKIDRDDMLPAVDQLLVAVNTAFQKMHGRPLWSPEVLQDRKHLSGSTYHFLDPKIPTKEFKKYKPSVGDIDTMVDRASKQEIEKFLQAIRNRPLGNFKLLNYDEETAKGKAERLKKGVEDKRAQFITQWEISGPVQFKGLQIDLELSDYEINPETGNPQPTDWARFSHSSSWEDIQQNIKGVFHKYIIQAITAISNTEKHRVDVLKTKTNINRTTDNNVGFAVASSQGGGMSHKYEPYTDPNTGETHRDNVPLMRAIPPAERNYVKGLGAQFQMLFGHQPTPGDLKLYESFIGCITLCNKYLNPQQKQVVADDFVNTCFELDAQMLSKNDPESDAKSKMAAVDYMAKNLKGINGKAIVDKANKMIVAYAEDHYDLQAYIDQHPEEKRPKMSMRQAKAAGTWQRGLGESLFEAEEPAVKAQLRKGMPHLKDLKSADFLDLLDELHQGNDRFQLKNIPLNVKVDGMGGRFGKSADGRPFMGTSRSEPRYAGGFLKGNIARYRKRLLAQQKGIADPKSIDDADPALKSITDQQVLDFMGPSSVAMSEKFDEQFNDYMIAIKIIDQQLGKEFLVNKQVTCEVLDINFAKETDEGKLVFVGIHYDKLPEGVKIAFVPFRVTDATTGEDLPDSADIVKQLTSLKKQGSVMFIDNSLTQKKALDVTAIVPPLKNIKQFKAMLDSKKRDQAAEVKAALEPVKLELEKAIINDPNIIGKDLLGKNYEGIVINSRLGPIKITSQEQRDVISAKNAANASARTERPRDNQNTTAVVAIGSAIGHIGHQQLFDFAVKKASETGGDPYFFIGNAEGKSDPIPVPDKVKTWHLLYPEYAKNISAVTMEGGSLLQKVKHELINPLKGMPPRYDTIYIVVGKDREKMANDMSAALMKAVNKFEGYEHVKAMPYVTGRNEDDGGTGVSGTALRNAIKTQSPEEAFAIWSNAFNKGHFGAKPLPAEWIKHLMDVARKSMGIPNVTTPAPANKQEQPAMATPQQKQEPQLQQEPMGERMMNAKNFAGSKKGQKAGIAGQARGEPGKSQKAPLKGLMVGENRLEEKWSQKYKKSINCSHPKGFSQKAHCAGKKKHNEDITMEMTCPDCGMCESHGTLNEIKKGQKDSNGFSKCWTGYHADGTQKGKNGGRVRKCVKNENVGIPVSEEVESIMGSLISLLEQKK